MEDTELFLALAEIAGVFVGFGALIAVRSGGASDALEVAPVRGVVISGMQTIIAALAPVTLGRYDLTEHQVLALSSILVLVSYSGLAFIHIRAPEFKAAAAVYYATRSRTFRFVEDGASDLLMGTAALALIVIALGVAPEFEAALYFTVVVFILIQAGWTLLWRAFMQVGPASV